MMLERLRRETSAEHRKVEALLDLVSPQLSLDRYRRILQGMFAAMEPLERFITEACPSAYTDLWKDRQKAWRLTQDLRLLGSAPDPALASAAALPELPEASLWLGAVYVVEGSTLGGQVICRHLEKHFGWSDGRGYSYFRGYGERTAERWRQVTHALQDKSHDGNLVVEGAHQTFRYLYSCLHAGLCQLPI